jgi:hypothetical protein
MAMDGIEGQSIGQLTSGIEPSTEKLILKTISFVHQQLPSWRDDPNRIIEEAEDRLNLQLCKFIDSCARNDFPMVRFDHEEYQFDRRRVDLSASPIEPMVIGARLYTIYNPILVIECKRLPAPPPKNREKEYVTGGADRSGGIQRFKLGLHGAALNSVVMIGYIQKYSLRYWYNKINEWISELTTGAIEDHIVWNETELLEMINECVPKGISSCKSVHNRTGSTISSNIQIYHFGIIMDIRTGGRP